MRAADLDDVLELVGFRLERIVAAVASPAAGAACTASAAAMCMADGNHVVAGLPAIHVVVGMRAGQPADHLVGVHVGGGAAAGLKDVDRELVVVPPCHHFFRRPLDVRPLVDIARRRS